jgi:hypothetical protein
MSCLDQFLDPKNGWFTPDAARQIVQWRPDDAVRARIQELGRKANSGELTPGEDAEYEQLIDEGDMIALLQLKARDVLERTAQ